MIILSANTKFSHYISRGSISSRVKLAEELNQKVFQRMLQLYGEKNNCGLGTIKNSYNAILPENKQINITPLPVKYYDEIGGGCQIEDSNDCLTGYSIEIPANKKNKLNILELPSFMHESTHVLDYLFNPKYIANVKKMYEMNIYDKKYYDLYSKYFYTDDIPAKNKKLILAEAEEETRKELSEVSAKEQIVFLNYMKYHLEMEEHAYIQGLMYAKILQKLGKPVDKESLEDYSKNLFIQDKIKLINKLLQEILSGSINSLNSHKTLF